MSKQVISTTVSEKLPAVCRRTERKLSFELKLETIEEESGDKYGRHCQTFRSQKSSPKLATSSSSNKGQLAYILYIIKWLIISQKKKLKCFILQFKSLYIYNTPSHYKFTRRHLYFSRRNLQSLHCLTLVSSNH